MGYVGRYMSSPKHCFFLFQEQDIFDLSPPFKNHLAKPLNVFLISTISFMCPGESYLQIGFSIGTCEVTRHQSGSILHKPQPGKKMLCALIPVSVHTTELGALCY